MKKNPQRIGFISEVERIKSSYKIQSFLSKIYQKFGGNKPKPGLNMDIDHHDHIHIVK